MSPCLSVSPGRSVGLSIIFHHFIARELFRSHPCARKPNKAGYTATSCGRVGRGRYECFPTFRLVLTDGPTDQWTDGPTDKPSYRVACPQLITNQEFLIFHVFMKLSKQFFSNMESESGSVLSSVFDFSNI